MNNLFSNRLWSALLIPCNAEYACASLGILCPLFTLAGFIAAGFLPPIPPAWDADRVVSHYRHHEKGIQVGAAFFNVAAMFYLAFTAAIAGQLQRIPNLPYPIKALQLSSGTASAFGFQMPGLVLAAAAYRLERSAETTQLLNDLFWFAAVLPVPSFMGQMFAFGYAVLFDRGPRPVFNRFISIPSIVVPILLVPALTVHAFKTGPLAWNGGVAFWLPAVAIGVQIIIECGCTAQAVYLEKTVNQRPHRDRSDETQI